MKNLNTQNAVVQQSIIPEFISGSSTLAVTKQQASKTLNQVQGLSNFMTTRGFTLIELLVVVLIIGILAAVALPQYQFAVVKSKVATILPIMKSIANAEEIYYLANGEYTNNLTLLEINPPAECSPLNTEGQHWKCGNDFLLFATGALTVYADYCPGYNGVDWQTCSVQREFQLQKYFKHISYTENNEPRNDKWGCVVKNNSSLGKKICDTFILQN